MKFGRLYPLGEEPEEYPTLTDEIKNPVWTITDEYQYETALDKTVKVLEICWILAVIYKVFRP